MKGLSENKEMRGVQIGFLFVLFAICIVWLAKQQFKIEQESILLSLIFLPALVYLIVAEKIQELKGPGGFEAKIAATGSQSISPKISEPIDPSIDEMMMVQKDATLVLDKIREKLSSSQPQLVSLEMILGDQRYDRYALDEYIKLLAQFSGFKFVIFLDANKKFVAYMQSWSCGNIMSNNQTAEIFLDGVRRGDLNVLRQFSSWQEKTVTSKTTHVEALQEMVERNQEALIVVDNDRNVKGVIERDYILSKMMLDIAATT